jgi:hypothetical protein
VEGQACADLLARTHVGVSGIFCDYFLSSATYFSPRRGCARVLKFCMEFKVTKK